MIRRLFNFHIKITVTLLLFILDVINLTYEKDTNPTICNYYF
jgi:hypothetical protein